MQINILYIYIVPRCLPTNALIPSRLNMLRPKSLVVVAAKGAHVLLQKQFANTSAIIFEIPVDTPEISHDSIMVLPKKKGWWKRRLLVEIIFGFYIGLREVSFYNCKDQLQCLLPVLRKDQSVQSGSN